MLLDCMAYLTTAAYAMSTFTRSLCWFLPITGFPHVSLKKKKKYQKEAEIKFSRTRGGTSVLI